MDDKQAKLFREEILKILRDNPKTAPKIYGFLKRKYPRRCDDTQKRPYHKIKWKSMVSYLLNKMQEEFIIYRDPLTQEWKIVE